MGMWKNQQGFTLLEVIIASGILLIVMLAFTEMFSYQQKQQQLIKVKANVQQIRNTVQSVGVDPAAIWESAQH